VEARLNQGRDSTSRLQLGDLPIVDGYSSSQYQEGNTFSPVKFGMVKNLQAYFARKDWNVSRWLWYSNFSLQVNTAKNLEILFTTTKEIDMQLTALEAYQSKYGLSHVRQIDLRSQLLAVVKK
jgi:hypothetical protein